MPHPVKDRIFPEPPDVLDLGFRQKQLHSPYHCYWHQNGRKCRLVAPAGFVYNGASVPKAVWSFYPTHSLDKAAVFHDLIYRRAGKMLPGEFQYFDAPSGQWLDNSGIWTRNAADTLFFKNLSKDPSGPGWFNRQAAYRVVRLFGGSRWG